MEAINRPLELWGGHECTVNRVGDRFFDQTVRTGHQDRISDLTRFAEIGFSALRYPVLWERTAPDQPDQRDWSWSDERLAEIRRLGMRPIAGLIHHGSGPRYTHLLDPGFATGLADHARAAAERYPWIEAWTPVNEPLTTARFSALYGFWYPHARDEGAFFTALLNQIDGVRLSMRAIRAVNPDAKLVQTEDLGHTFATAPLGYQAHFDNERRWLAWDLLTVGVNYYLSSERFLDHRVERYPLHRRGGNGEDAYADVEAVRAVQPSPMGLERLLDATWKRYGLPMAVTESHNGCTREEQMRWLHEAWTTAGTLRGRGVPMQAVTAWSLLGAYDWDQLLQVDHGKYEVGVYDLRGGEPRPTAAVELCRALAHGETPAQAVLDNPGWWSRDIRFEFEPVWCPHPDPVKRRWSPAAAHPRPLLITGATGTLGRALARGCEHRGVPYILTCRQELAIDDAEAARRLIEAVQPWAVINAAGWVRVDEAEADEAGCMLANAQGPALLAQACAEAGVAFATYSSDLVFDGTKGAPYVEADAPCPLSAYGRSKAEAEAAVLAAHDKALVIRTAAFFSPFDPHNFAQGLVRSLTAGEPFQAAGDLVVSPTYTPDLVQASLDLLIDGEAGIWHLANPGQATWSDFAHALARACGLDGRLIRTTPSAQFGWAAPRPAAVALASTRGPMMPPLEDAISRFAHVLGPMGGPVRTRAPQVVREPPRVSEPKTFAANFDLF
ncbi:MAG: dTDP-4-dehydrorhamnose reductase [Caulobacterales bacterium 32-69-10]|nr:MAG: dTDP-4-dehydrorhamnose reductase [Caulobacterales bacterium 32-69-10]